ncbi:MAG TPA: metallophosphoesterase [Holophagaceae bacterium]|nr:metallophosphoesterase [Holophagaceae bacterium]
MLFRLLTLLLAFASLSAQDGPYVQWQGSQAQIFSIEDGKLVTRRARAPFDLPLPGMPPIRLTGKPIAPDAAMFPAPEKIVAVSDIHGHFDDLLALLKVHGVVNDRLRWAFGKGHLVIAGDVMDRGDQVTQAFWFIRSLEIQAKRAGGRVHMLIGNHENMVAAGDLRYTNPLYANAPEGMPGLVERYGPDGEFGRWLRAKPALLKLGPFLFLHGGVSPELAARHYTLATVNATLRAHFGELGGAGADEASFLLGPQGPLWFRGLIPGEEGEVTDAQVDDLLAYFGVRAIVVGHTTEGSVEALHGGKVFAIDAGLKEGRGEVWIWERGKAYRGLKDGQRLPLD